MKKCTLLLLIAAMLTSISCGGSTGNTDTTAASTSGTNETTTEANKEYDFGEKLDGREINYITLSDRYSMHIQVDREETTGDALNDAMYNRCRKVEEMLGIKLKEQINTDGTTALNTQIYTLVSAGDDSLDFVFVAPSASYARPISTEGILYNLYDFDELQLDEPWWFKSYNDGSSFNGVLFQAASAANLCFLDSLQVIYVNEDILTDRNLDLPYDLVREGKWTMDKMFEYQTKTASLNGADSFDFNEKASTIYGLASHSNSINQFLVGAGEFIIGIKDDKLALMAGTERFYDAVEKTVAMHDYSSGIAVRSTGASDDDPGANLWLFENERAAFMITELSKANRMRDKDYNYGVLPFPKFDEEQDRYYAQNGMAFNFAIPVSCKDANISARIGDAMAYVSDEMVTDVWREVTVEQKALRNDDSIEMLGIMMDSLTTTSTFGIGSSLSSEIRTKLVNADASVASLVESHRSSIEAEIAKLYE